MGFPNDSLVKNLPATLEEQETWVQSSVREDPLEECMATHSSILAWEIPWTAGSLAKIHKESMGSQRVGRNSRD